MLGFGVLHPPPAIKGVPPAIRGNHLPLGVSTRNLVDEARKGRGDTEGGGEEKEAPIKVVVLVATRGLT